VPHAPHPTFSQVYDCLRKHGPATVISRGGTRYTVEAKPDKNKTRAIIGYPARGQVRIHEDCWGNPKTCSGTRTGGLLNGNPSIYDWYDKTCGKSTKGKSS